MLEAEKLKPKPEEEEDQMLQWVVALIILIIGGSILIGLSIMFYRTKCCE